jgi:hypothetical protein
MRKVFCVLSSEELQHLEEALKKIGRRAVAVKDAGG